MKIKYQSEGIRKGPGPDHEKAVSRVIDFWQNFSSPKYSEWHIDTEWHEPYSDYFRSRNPDRNRIYPGHDPDIAFWVLGEDAPILKLVIEVDGESHDKLDRKIKDKIFEKWIGTHYYGYVKVIRINKRELIGPIDLAEEELRNKLAEYLSK